jgi:hypothetical protein
VIVLNDHRRPEKSKGAAGSFALVDCWRTRDFKILKSSLFTHPDMPFVKRFVVGKSNSILSIWLSIVSLSLFDAGA